MGIDSFLLDILEIAGRPVDLRDYANGKEFRGRSHFKRCRRKYRIGIDLTSLLNKAADEFCDMLPNNENALVEQESRQQFRKKNAKIHEYRAKCAEFVMKRLKRLRNDSDCDVLVVFEGQTLPGRANNAVYRRDIRIGAPSNPSSSKKAQIDANGELLARAETILGPIILDFVKTLKESDFEYLVAPYEASSQLAFMSSRGQVDLIISEYSKLLGYGARTVIYNYIRGDGSPDGGRLLQFEDIGLTQGRLNLLDFSPVMIATLMVAIDCINGLEKLGGIGMETAGSIVKEAFYGGYESPLDTILGQLCRMSRKEDWNDDEKGDFEHTFISGVFMYQHPIVFDRMQGKALIRGQREMAAASKLKIHKSYARLCREGDERSQTIGIIKGLEVEQVAAGTSGYSKNKSWNDKTLNGSDREHPTTLPDDSCCGDIQGFNRKRKQKIVDDWRNEQKSAKKVATETNVQCISNEKGEDQLDDCPRSLREIFESDFKKRDRTHSSKYLKMIVDTLWRRAPEHIKKSVPSVECGNEELRRWKAKHFGEETPRPVFVRGCPELLIDMLRDDIVRKKDLSHKNLTRLVRRSWNLIPSNAKKCLTQEKDAPNYFYEVKKWKLLHIPDAAEVVTTKPSKPKVPIVSPVSHLTKGFSDGETKAGSENDLQDINSCDLKEGDLVCAPYPNIEPVNEVWRLGTVVKKKRGNPLKVDVVFAAGLESLGVKRENLFKLETQDYKDSVLQVNDIVYAPYPGSNPENELYYWGRISKSFKSKEKKSVYQIDFPDGDTTKQTESSFLYRYSECIHMMKMGWLENDEPPENLAHGFGLIQSEKAGLHPDDDFQTLMARVPNDLLDSGETISAAQTKINVRLSFETEKGAMDAASLNDGLMARVPTSLLDSGETISCDETDINVRVVFAPTTKEAMNAASFRDTLVAWVPTSLLDSGKTTSTARIDINVRVVLGTNTKGAARAAGLSDVS